MLPYGKTLVDPSLAVRPNLLKWTPKKPEMAFETDATDPKAYLAALRQWQKKARKQFEKCLGDELPKSDPKPRVLAKQQMDGYTRTTFTLATSPGLRALCWLLLPDGASDASPLPAMIATPGHGLGAKDLMAMDKHGKPRKEGEGYQKDYGLAAVRQGKAVLVVEPLGFGERRDVQMIKAETHESGCMAANAVAGMLGTTLARIRIHDVQQALTYFQAQKGVDASRIGMMGISGGGQLTLWTAAVEPRLKLSIVSGYYNTFTDSVMAMHHCVCNFMPGLRKHFEMVDLALMSAPRPMLIQSGTQDRIFPINASRKAVSQLRQHYKKLGMPQRLEHDVFEGEHQWSATKVNAFLDKWL